MVYLGVLTLAYFTTVFLFTMSYLYGLGVNIEQIPLELQDYINISLRPAWIVLLVLGIYLLVIDVFDKLTTLIGKWISSSLKFINLKKKNTPKEKSILGVLLSFFTGSIVFLLLLAFSLIFIVFIIFVVLLIFNTGRDFWVFTTFFIAYGVWVAISWDAFKSRLDSFFEHSEVSVLALISPVLIYILCFCAVLSGQSSLKEDSLGKFCHGNCSDSKAYVILALSKGYLVRENEKVYFYLEQKTDEPILEFKNKPQPIEKLFKKSEQDKRHPPVQDTDKAQENSQD